MHKYNQDDEIYYSPEQESGAKAGGYFVDRVEQDIIHATPVTTSNATEADSVELWRAWCS